MQAKRVLNFQLSMVLASAILLIGVGFLGQVVWAQGSNNNSGGVNLNGDQIEKWCTGDINQETKDGKEVESMQDCRLRYIMSGSGTKQGDSCKDANDAFIKSSRAFHDSCVESNAKSCIQQALDCDGSRHGDNSDDGDTPKLPKGMGKNTLTQNSQLMSCPPLATANYQKLKEAKEKYGDKVSDLKDKLETLQQKASDIQAKMANAKSDYQTKVQDIQTELKKAQSDLGEKVQDQAEKATQKSNEMMDSITQLTEKSQEALDKALSDTHKEDQICFDNAMKALQAYLADRRSKIDLSKLTAGGQNGLFTGAGVSQNEKNGDVAFQYYQYCMTHPPHTTNVIDIANQRKLALKEITDRIASITRDRADMLNQAVGTPAQQKETTAFNNLQTESVTATKKAAQDLQDEINKLTPQLNALMGGQGNQCANINSSSRLTDPENTLCTSALFKSGSGSKMAGAAGTDGEIARVRLELQKAQAESDSAEQLFKTAEMKAGGQDTDKYTFPSDFDEYMSDAGSVFDKCTCKDKPKSNNCAKAEKALRTAGSPYSDDLPKKTGADSPDINVQVDPAKAATP
jgi:hypothetical protein